MSDLLDIKLVINEDCPNLTVTIENDKRDEDVERVISALQEYASKKSPMISAYYKGSLVMIPQRQIIRIYVFDRKVMIQTEERLYEFKKPLKDVEDVLDSERFVRISQSEIINFDKVKSFDFSKSGTIGVILVNGESTYVARRRVKDIKEALERGDNYGQ